MILKELIDQAYLGMKLIMRGNLSKSWKQAVIHTQEGKQKTMATGICWSRMATNQIWLLDMNAQKERNEALHKDSNSNIA